MRVVSVVSIVLVVSVPGCAVTGPTTDLDTIEPEWALGQRGVERYVGDRAYDVWPDQFNWKREPTAFPCGSGVCNGTFDWRRRLITWNAETPQVIRHEACHAILWKLEEEYTDESGRCAHL